MASKFVLSFIGNKTKKHPTPVKEKAYMDKGWGENQLLGKYRTNQQFSVVFIIYIPHTKTSNYRFFINFIIINIDTKFAAMAPKFRSGPEIKITFTVSTYFIIKSQLDLLAELKNRLKISIFLWRKKLCISLIFSNFVVSNYKVIYFTLCTTCMQIS